MGVARGGLGEGDAAECLSITSLSGYRWSHFPSSRQMLPYDSRPVICMFDRQQTALCMSKQVAVRDSSYTMLSPFGLTLRPLCMSPSQSGGRWGRNHGRPLPLNKSDTNAIISLPLSTPSTASPNPCVSPLSCFSSRALRGGLLRSSSLGGHSEIAERVIYCVR